MRASLYIFLRQGNCHNILPGNQLTRIRLLFRLRSRERLLRRNSKLGDSIFEKLTVAVIRSSKDRLVHKLAVNLTIYKIKNKRYLVWTFIKENREIIC